MKEGLAILIALVLLINFVAAQEVCDVDVELLNQEPYPAVQGDLVKLVFQIKGIESTSCSNLKVELLEQYPFTLDPGSEKFYQIKSGTFSKDFSSTFLAPFKVRVDKNALDGENPIEIKYSYGVINPSQQTKSFNIEVQDVRASFEIFVKDYNPSTGEITFNILNTGKEEIEALTIEIPKQEGIEIKGANKNIVGDLDSNEDTSADFKLFTTLSEIKVNLIYSDINNQRREVSTTVAFERDNFKLEDSEGSSLWKWILSVLIIIGLVYWKKKRKHKK